MKTKLITAFLGLLISVIAPISNAQVVVGFGFDSCGYPGYYQTCPAYGPPVGVYLGGGGWGGGRGRDFHGGRGGAQHGAQRGGRHR